MSLGSPALLQFLEPPPASSSAADGSGGRKASRWQARVVASVLLRPGSLVVFAENAYCTLMHGVADADQEVVGDSTINKDLIGAHAGDIVTRGNRLSLTLRRVRDVAVEPGEFLQPTQQEEASRRRSWWARAISEKP